MIEAMDFSTGRMVFIPTPDEQRKRLSDRSREEMIVARGNSALYHLRIGTMSKKIEKDFAAMMACDLEAFDKRTSAIVAKYTVRKKRAVKPKETKVDA